MMCLGKAGSWSYRLVFDIKMVQEEKGVSSWVDGDNLSQKDLFHWRKGLFFCWMCCSAIGRTFFLTKWCPTRAKGFIILCPVLFPWRKKSFFGQMNSSVHASAYCMASFILTLAEKSIRWKLKCLQRPKTPVSQASNPHLLMEYQ